MSVLRNILLSLLLLSLVAACAPPHHRHYRTHVEPEPQPAELATEVYYYPMHGQSMAQQERDRYECYLWAKDQTGFDPSQPRLLPHQRTHVVPDPEPGSDTLAGVLTGATVGAIIGSPHDTGKGAVIGAIAGGMLGAVSDAERQEYAEHLEQRYNRRAMNRQEALERQAADYRRAMKACLSGRGYSVR